MKQIVSIGIGLIGGSLAKELKKLYPEATLFGIDNNARHMEQALKLGLIDAEATYTELAKADLVILSVPVDAAAKLLPEILDHIADHTLVLDMGSTKQNNLSTLKTKKKRKKL